MDQISLVTEQIDAGALLIKEFNKYAPIKTAFWLQETEASYKYLYLISDEIDDSNFDLAYGEVGRIMRKHPQEWLDPFRIKVAGVKNPIAKKVIELNEKYPRPIENELGYGRFIDLGYGESYIYPPVDFIKKKARVRKSS